MPGVDIDAATRGLERAKRAILATHTGDCVGGVGGFGGLFRLPTGLTEGLLVASTDGAGTKIHVARMAGRHETVGEDLANHCVNDVLVQAPARCSCWTTSPPVSSTRTSWST